MADGELAIKPLATPDLYRTEQAAMEAKVP